MKIFELVKPGIMVRMDDGEDSRVVNLLVGSIIGQFYDANISFIDFVSRRKTYHPPRMGTDQWHKINALSDKVRKGFLKSVSKTAMKEDWLDVNFQADIVVKRAIWSEFPESCSLRSRLVYVSARSFLYSLDNYSKLLDKLIVRFPDNESLLSAKATIASSFPGLKAARDSAHHIEDRILSLGRQDKRGRQKKIVPDAINNGYVQAGDGAFFSICNLFGNRLSYTTEKGGQAEIEISEKSMETLYQATCKILKAFDWSGPKQHYPL